MTTERAVLAGGCFWGVQDLLRRHNGILSTRVGYTGGNTPNATYRNHGRHAEAVEVIFDPARISYRELLEIFFQIHDPTTRNRQGNDVGTQYRSGIYWTSEAQRDAALASRDMFQKELASAGYGEITTEIAEAGPFYYAEDYHQQYLEANPNGYCGLGGTGVSCPAPVRAASD